MRTPRSVLLLALLLPLVVPGCSGETEEVSVEDALSPVRFYREYVTVEPSRGSTKVSALYYFRNESDRDVTQGISYPFPVDRNHLYPHTVRVWETDGEDLTPMGFVHRRMNVLWTMDIAAGETKTVRVDYTQEIREPRAVYIVTTTQEWKRPIEVAEFEFRVPSGIGEHTLSFEPDRTEVRGDTTVYYVSFEDFMPDEDLVVTWTD